MAAGAARRAGGVRGGGTESTLDAADEGSKLRLGGAAEQRHGNDRSCGHGWVETAPRRLGPGAPGAETTPATADERSKPCRGVPRRAVPRRGCRAAARKQP